MIVALWGRDQLAEDSGVEDPGGWGGITLAYNCRSPEEVDAVIEEARAAGARRSRVRARRPSGAATRASSSTPTATRGRSRTTRTGRSGPTARLAPLTVQDGEQRQLHAVRRAHPHVSVLQGVTTGPPSRSAPPARAARPPRRSPRPRARAAPAPCGPPTWSTKSI